jgi:hypothetical protein
MNISASSLPSAAVASLLAARSGVASQGAHVANLVTQASDDQATSMAAMSSGSNTGSVDVYL